MISVSFLISFPVDDKEDLKDSEGVVHLNAVHYPDIIPAEIPINSKLFFYHSGKFSDDESPTKHFDLVSEFIENNLDGIKKQQERKAKFSVMVYSTEDKVNMESKYLNIFSSLNCNLMFQKWVITPETKLHYAEPQKNA